MSRRVAIAGFALSKVGRVDNVTPYALMAQASGRALADAGVAPRQIDGFVEGGKLRLGGALPTNTDDGGFSACHPGQRGRFLIVEATRQLRGVATDRQMPDAEIACVSGMGGRFCSNGTMLLGAG